MKAITLPTKPDNIGALASTLCMIHCFATPFIFIAQTCSKSCCATAPSWWRFIDYFFLIISFFAVYESVKTSTSTFIKYGLWISWIALFATIANEQLAFIHIPESIKYSSAAALVVLHLYNRKYCRCTNNTCCAK